MLGKIGTLPDYDEKNRYNHKLVKKTTLSGTSLAVAMWTSYIG